MKNTENEVELCFEVLKGNKIMKLEIIMMGTQYVF